jgi:molecular chaperone GrpE (heat shock protein)
MNDQESHLNGHLLRLAAQADHLQEKLTRLYDEVRESSSQIDTLTHNLTDSATAKSIDNRLAELLTHLESNQEQLGELASAVTKLSRTQYKSNALFESQQQKTESALSTLQEIIDRREELRRERALEDREYLDRQRREARAELAADLLPVIDGIESALENGRVLLERRRERWKEVAGKPESEPPSLWKRLSYVINSDALLAGMETGPSPASESYDALAAWLEGLRLVRDRFLGLLAAEDIRPIPDIGQPFDPHLHVAVEAVQSNTAAPGQIVAVSSKGYRQGERVLRYSEVIVAREGE